MPRTGNRSTNRATRRRDAAQAKAVRRRFEHARKHELESKEKPSGLRAWLQGVLARLFRKG